MSLRLVKSHSHNSPLTCINFIKSHLTMETFSNLSQDIDLVSQEILLVGKLPFTSRLVLFYLFLLAHTISDHSVSIVE